MVFGWSVALGWFWLVWLVLVGFVWFWLILGGFKWFWLVLVGFGWFWLFWLVFVGFGWSCGSGGKGTVADRGALSARW